MGSFQKGFQKEPETNRLGPFRPTQLFFSSLSCSNSPSKGNSFPTPTISFAFLSFPTKVSTMRSILLPVFLLSSWAMTISNNSFCHGFSFNFDSLSSKHVLSSSAWSQSSTSGPTAAASSSNKNLVNMATTRRETIKMPSQTPMVPWTVCMIFCFCLDAMVFSS